MFGNKEGWLMSVAIVVLAGLMLWKLELLSPPGIAKPSGQFKNLRELIALPVKPEDALAGVMAEERDAGDLYWEAIKLYREAPEPYDKTKPRYTQRLGELKAIDLLVEATSALIFLVAKYQSRTTKSPELIFSALVSNDGARKCAGQVLNRYCWFIHRRTTISSPEPGPPTGIVEWWQWEHHLATPLSDRH